MRETRFRSLSTGDRRDALQVAAGLSGRTEHLLDKDVWVVGTLRTLFDSRFGGRLTIEAGLYICYSLIMNGIAGRFTVKPVIPELTVFGSEADGPDAEFPLRFEGGVRVPVGPNAGGQKELHLIRAPRAR